MNEQEKLNKVADILDVNSESITASTRLDEIGWDSMSMLGIIALARANGKRVNGDVLKTFITVDDIVKTCW